MEDGSAVNVTDHAHTAEDAPGTASSNNAVEKIAAVETYTRKGWVVHPLSNPKGTGDSPGKKPLLKDWQNLAATPQVIEEYIKKGCNIGMVCGARSGAMVVDYDLLLFWEIVIKGLGLFTLSSQRTPGRGHVVFQYTDELKSQKHHLLGIEILSDGSNAVLPPSVHTSGEVYKWVNPDAPIASMPPVLIERLKLLFQTEQNLVQYISECRPCFKEAWNKGKPAALHGGDGREVMLAWATELKAKGAGLDEILMLARLVYKNEFSSKETSEEWKNIKSKPWTCKKIKERLSSIISCSDCPFEKKRKGTNWEDKRKNKELPPIPFEEIEPAPCDLDELLTVFRKWLYIEEDYNITAPVCGFIGNFVKGESDIIGIVGPSGSIKTELIRSFGETENQYSYPISSVTEHTFVSGHEDNIDTVPLLRRRAILIKDLTTLLSRKEDIRAAIFADFREITDGYIRKEYGNGVKKEYGTIHSSIIFASTNAIERYYSMYSNLGQRMIFLRPRNDPKEARQRSEKNRNKLEEIRKELHATMMRFVKTTLDGLTKDGNSSIPDEIKNRIGELCDFLAKIRTPIHHDIKGEIDEIPEPEFPTRVYNTICKLTEIHTYIRKCREADKDDEAFAYRIVLDNIPTLRLQVLKYMTLDWQTTTSICKQARLPTETGRRVLEELVALNLASKITKEDLEDLEEEEIKELGLDKRMHSYSLTQEASACVDRLRSVIRYGDMIYENIKEKEKTQKEENNTIPPERHSSIDPHAQAHREKSHTDFSAIEQASETDANQDHVPNVPTVPTVTNVTDEKGINGTVGDSSEINKHTYARDACKEQLTSSVTVETEGTVETHGTDATAQEICGICENLRTPPISMESGEKSPAAHAGTDGNNHNLNDSDGGRAKITIDSPDESQKFGHQASPIDRVTQGNLQDEAAMANVRPALERAGKQWQDMNSRQVNSTNLTQFLMWFCSQYAKDRKPTDFQDIASRIFKITPSAVQSGNPDDKAAEHEMIKLRFLVDNIPVFVGSDERRYGPFWKGAEAEVPAVNAMALFKRQAAVKIENRPEGAKDDQKDIKERRTE